jgi:putative oxidoreductase
MNTTLSFLGRAGLSLLFIISGWGKLNGYAATQHYMQSLGIPAGLLPFVILLELGGGLAVAAGLFTRWVALALAAFSVATAVIAHTDFNDAAQAINFWKNLGIAGGFLLLVAHGAGAFSLDALLHRRDAAHQKRS